MTIFIDYLTGLSALQGWKILWSTTIGTGELSVKLDELDVPATVVGYFFEKLFVKYLEINYPDLWRGGRSKNEKDIVYIPDNDLDFSIELKTSGLKTIQNLKNYEGRNPKLLRFKEKLKEDGFLYK
jgi:hypothetical protein